MVVGYLMHMPMHRQVEAPGVGSTRAYGVRGPSGHQEMNSKAPSRRKSLAIERSIM